MTPKKSTKKSSNTPPNNPFSTPGYRPIMDSSSSQNYQYFNTQSPPQYQHQQQQHQYYSQQFLHFNPSPIQPQYSQQFPSQFQSQPRDSQQESDSETDNDIEHVSESEPENDEEPTRKGKGIANNKKKFDSGRWNADQEVELARAWCGISEDQMTGSSQQRDKFWERVAERYSQNIIIKGGKPRDKGTCNRKWAHMNKVVALFNNIYINQYNQWASGDTEPLIMTKARRIFYDTTTANFKHDHVWNEVKKSEKWKQQNTVEHSHRSTKRNKVADQQQVDLNDDPLEDPFEEQPPRSPTLGRDAAKRKARAGSQSSVNTQASTRSEELTELKAEFAGLRTSLDNHMLWAAGREQEQSRQEDMKLLFQDVSHLSGPMLEFAMAEKARILAKYSSE